MSSGPSNPETETPSMDRDSRIPFVVTTQWASGTASYSLVDAENRDDAIQQVVSAYRAVDTPPTLIVMFSAKPFEPPHDYNADE